MNAEATGSRRGKWELVLALQAASTQAAWQGIRVMLAYQALAETNSPTFVGIVVALIAFAGLIVSVPSGRLIDRFGGARIAALGIAISLLGVIAGLIWHNIAGILITATLVGAGCSQIVVAQQSVVARLSAAAKADAAFARLTAAVSIGQLIGPPVATVAASLAASGAEPNTWVGSAAAGALFLIVLPAFFVLRRAELAAPPLLRSPGAPPASMRTVLRNPGILRAIIVGTAVIVTVDLLTSFVPVWAVEQGITADVVGWLLALRAFFTIAGRAGSARLVARFGRKTLLIAMLSLAVVALVLLPFSGVWAALPIMAALGVGLGMPQPLTLVWMSNLAPRHARGAVFGARMAVNKLGQVSLPVVVATVAGPLGVIPMLWSTAAVLATGLVVVFATSSAELAAGPVDEASHDPPAEPNRSADRNAQ